MAFTVTSLSAISKEEWEPMKLTSLDTRITRIVVLPRSLSNSLLMAYVERLNTLAAPCCWVSEDLRECDHCPAEMYTSLLYEVLKCGAGRKATDTITKFLLRQCYCEEHIPQAQKAVKELWIRGPWKKLTGPPGPGLHSKAEALWQKDQQFLTQDKRLQSNLRFAHVASVDSGDRFRHFCASGFGEPVEKVAESMFRELVVPLEGPPRSKCRGVILYDGDIWDENKERGDGKRDAMMPGHAAPATTLSVYEDRKRSRSVGARRPPSTEAARVDSRMHADSEHGCAYQQRPWASLRVDWMRDAPLVVHDEWFITKVIQSPLPQVLSSQVGYVYVVKSPELDLIRVGVSTTPIDVVPGGCSEIIADYQVLNATDQPLLEYERLAELVRAHLRRNRCLFSCHCVGPSNGKRPQLRTELTEWFHVPEDVALKTLRLWRFWLSQKPYRSVTGTSSSAALLNASWQKAFKKSLVLVKEEEAKDPHANLQRWTKFLQDAIADTQRANSADNVQPAEPSVFTLSKMTQTESPSFCAPLTSPPTIHDDIFAANPNPKRKPPSSSEVGEKKGEMKVKHPEHGPPMCTSTLSPDHFLKPGGLADHWMGGEGNAKDGLIINIEPPHPGGSPREEPAIERDEQGNVEQPTDKPDITAKQAEPKGNKSKMHGIATAAGFMPTPSATPPPAEELSTHGSEDSKKNESLTMLKQQLQALLSQECPALSPRTIQEDLIGLRWALASATIFALASPHLPALLASVVWMLFLPVFVAELRGWQPSRVD